MNGVTIRSDDQVDGAVLKVQPLSVWEHLHLHPAHPLFSRARMAARTRSGVAGVRVMRAPVA